MSFSCTRRKTAARSKPACACAAGAYLLLQYADSNVAIDRLQSLIDSYLRQEKFSKVAAHFSKPAAVPGGSRRRLQIVLADVGTYRGDCGDLAAILAQRVRNSKLATAVSLRGHQKRGHVMHDAHGNQK
jgi:hypothetical protein